MVRNYKWLWKPGRSGKGMSWAVGGVKAGSNWKALVFSKRGSNCSAVPIGAIWGFKSIVA